MEEEDLIGCISCMSTNDLCNLFAVYSENPDTYAKMLEKCFNIKISNELKYVCTQCVQRLEDAIAFKEQTTKSIAMLQGIREEEYLDEAILDEEEVITPDDPPKASLKRAREDSANDMDEDDEEALDDEENTCIYCDMVLPSRTGVNNHIRVVHGLEPRDDGGVGPRHECELCAAVFHTGIAMREHLERCHGVLKSSDAEGKQFPCHFCDNVYSGRKACYTHLRMKHGLKLSTDQTVKYRRRERKKCHVCNKDFSQKQILNKHLWKEHGYEVERRKAFICPLCDERVSYGTHFEQHLLSEHRLEQRVQHLQFSSMDDFMLYKSQIQEETKCRFRKTTASKQTIEGLRSHYMCSQSGVYVYQGKGIRPAPERQIYKTGKACPAHMVVTETIDRVLVIFHMTHVGHGACPYYEPRDLKQKCSNKLEKAGCCGEDLIQPKDESGDNTDENALGWICDSCGMGFLDGDQFKRHAATHGIKLYPCHYCDNVYQNIDAWTRHLRVEHNVASIF